MSSLCLITSCSTPDTRLQHGMHVPGLCHREQEAGERTPSRTGRAGAAAARHRERALEAHGQAGASAASAASVVRVSVGASKGNKTSASRLLSAVCQRQQSKSSTSGMLILGLLVLPFLFARISALCAFSSAMRSALPLAAAVRAGAPRACAIFLASAFMYGVSPK